MRDNCRSLQLTKLSVEIKENLASVSQKLDTGSFITLLLISRSEFLTLHHVIQHNLLWGSET